MNAIKIDELRRAAQKAGRGENVSVDAEDLLELLATQNAEEPIHIDTCPHCTCACDQCAGCG